ncbi:cysteine desulfurase IscS [Moorella sp. E308F]|jgi:cysteine desulfurase|uniref:cysteine desulfurase NifS n=1 Tax=unclassified Neomoorella TaxID=2676739 RepID=UPI0010FFB129|nr:MULTISPECIES: cysteine desulfurase NifS [unclassified Moorella (in: firmicutes)]GEA16086.1 cysteine desulfurase IscS [Moorella sp. E308F]GEA19067.1 cysteine desulfurase IscS [Moorella sp. E306M]
MRRVYLDHSATTPVRPEVLDAMLPFLKEDAFGNPSTIYSYGREAKKALDEAREKVAGLIGARPEEIFFTSGGTEADNLALIGTATANEKKGRHIITSSIEHHAVLHTAQYLMRLGFKVTFLPVTPEGLVRVEDVEEAITPETILISVMHVNNEVGTIQPIKEIGQLARERGIIFHTDAVQSVGKIPVNVDELNVDLLSASGHKIYGPKGVGCLYIRKGTRINPLLHGGAQERKRRPGTENMPGIVGFGRAAELAGQELPQEMKRLQALRDKLIDGILNRIEDVQLNGDREKRVATNANFSFRYVEGESLLLSLDMKGICASSGSACTSGSLDPSHVLLAMGIPHEVAHGSVRMTLGRDNTEADIDYVLEVMPEIVARLRAMSPLYNR